MPIPDEFNAASYFIDRHIAEGRGEAIAFECGDRRVSYRALFEGVNAVGNGLRQLGIRKGDRILLALPDIPEFGMYFFGAIKIGAVPVPVNPSLSAADQDFLLQDSGARLKIVDPTALTFTPEIELAAEPMRSDEAAFWLYSSGSTGAPKACVHRQRDMLVCAEHYAKGVLGITEADRCFSTSKLFFAYGLGNALYYPLAAGATSILFPERPTPENIFEIIKRHRPTIFFAVPSHYAAMVDHADFSSVRLCVSAAEPLPATLFASFKERFGKEILDSIGSTEALQAFIAQRAGTVRPGSAGQLVPGYEAKILDDAHVPVSLGEYGNLWIKNEAIFMEYWHQPEKTRLVLRDGWLRTGDIFSQDNDGYFWYRGRADDMFKSSGAWVSPIEVEHLLLEHPAVREAAVVGKKNAAGLIKPMAYVVLRDSPKATLATTVATLQEFCASRLPRFKRPDRIEVIAELPKTATGKIQRFKLREIVRLPEVPL